MTSRGASCQRPERKALCQKQTAREQIWIGSQWNPQGVWLWTCLLFSRGFISGKGRLSIVLLGKRGKELPGRGRSKPLGSSAQLLLRSGHWVLDCPDLEPELLQRSDQRPSEKKTRKSVGLEVRRTSWVVPRRISSPLAPSLPTSKNGWTNFCPAYLLEARSIALLFWRGGVAHRDEKERGIWRLLFWKSCDGQVEDDS